MLSEFVRDLADPDRPIVEASKERPDKPLRIRIQPNILRVKSGRTQYRSWPDVRWTLECDTTAEAFALRDAMRTFFEAMAECGPEAVRKSLRPLIPRTKKKESAA